MRIVSKRQMYEVHWNISNLTFFFIWQTVSDTTESLTSALAGAQSLVIAVGFVPGNPLKMNAAAHEVDNVGTCKLIVSVSYHALYRLVCILLT